MAKTPLHREWVLWFDNPRLAEEGQSWRDNLKECGTFSSVETFWEVFNNVQPASALSTNSNYRPAFGRGRSGSKAKRTVVVHSNLDINPLAPCGACNEWLKKIAESNPYFKVLTFTDADCNGVYITPVIE